VVITNNAGGYGLKSGAQDVLCACASTHPDGSAGRYFYLRDQESGEYWSVSGGRQKPSPVQVCLSAWDAYTLSVRSMPASRQATTLRGSTLESHSEVTNTSVVRASFPL
jgi:hypothetical protein